MLNAEEASDITIKSRNYIIDDLLESEMSRILAAAKSGIREIVFLSGMPFVSKRDKEILEEKLSYLGYYIKKEKYSVGYKGYVKYTKYIKW